MNGCGSGSHKCKAPYWEIVWLLSAFVWPAPSLSPTKTQFPMPLLCTINDDSGHQSLGCAAYQTPHKSLTMHSVEEGINLCTMMWTAPYIQHISEYMSKFRPILLNGIWLYDTQNTFYLIVTTLKDAFFMRFTSLLEEIDTLHCNGVMTIDVMNNDNVWSYYDYWYPVQPALINSFQDGADHAWMCRWSMWRRPHHQQVTQFFIFSK